MHALETLFSRLSLKFQIVSNSVRIYALNTLFLQFSLKLQIVQNSVRLYALYLVFKLVSEVPK